MKKIIFMVALLFLASAISLILVFKNTPITFHSVVSINQDFSIPIPAYLSPSNQLDSAAALQFSGQEKNIILLVYKHSITNDTTLHGYFKQLTSKLINSIDNGVILKYYPDTINGNNAWVGNIYGETNCTKVYYRIALIKSSNCYYELVWGTENNIRTSYDADMNATINGFRVRH